MAMLLASTAAWAGAPQWTISEATGKVSVATRGVSKIAVRGGVLAAGDTVSTGPGGRAVVVRGEEYLVVAPNTRFRIADPSTTNGLTQIIEQAGNILFRIKKMATPHFAVQTPYLAAVVKGTTFSVTVSETGASVQVVEGKVEVATNDGGARHLVTPGDIGAVRAGSMNRLEVVGREDRVIQSANPPSPAPGTGDEPDATGMPVASPVATTVDGQIATEVFEPPVQLAAVTNGMIGGEVNQGALATARTSDSRLNAAGDGGNDASSTAMNSLSIASAGNNGNVNGNGNAGATETSGLTSETNTPASEINTPASETNTPASEINTPASETNTPASEISVTPAPAVPAAPAAGNTGTISGGAGAVAAIEAPAPAAPPAGNTGSISGGIGAVAAIQTPAPAPPGAGNTGSISGGGGALGAIGAVVGNAIQNFWANNGLPGAPGPNPATGGQSNDDDDDDGDDGDDD